MEESALQTRPSKIEENKETPAAAISRIQQDIGSCDSAQASSSLRQMYGTQKEKTRHHGFNAQALRFAHFDHFCLALSFFLFQQYLSLFFLALISNKSPLVTFC
mmetsp:Transcript_4160/g.8929  ORF Transcript_4160/g.8929 Transcript_4160/m.8929 type:complete len:104 (-) Transcript_4160:634-945(-)